MWLTAFGFVCGFLAGTAAQYGRLCTMRAIESAFLSGDFRLAKAFGLALSLSMVGTALLAVAMGLDLASSVYTTSGIGLGGALIGGVLFGLGMALVGTCSFGLLVRAGTGDLRAMVSVSIVGITAFAATGGLLAQPRALISQLWVMDPKTSGGPLLPGFLATQFGLPTVDSSISWPLLLALLLALPVILDERLRQRPRLMLAAIVLGLAIVAGWAASGHALAELETTRLESLSFVAPVGRLLLQVMSEGLADAGFGVASVLGVLSGSVTIAAMRGDTRWEAFDDQREMRRHILGAALMGFGGVLARGCTIGQGLSAASILAVTAPLAILGMLIGARLGLIILFDGGSFRRIIRSASRGSRRPAAIRAATDKESPS